MKHALLLGLGLAAVSAMPAFADGYRDAPPPNRGPAPLSTGEQSAHHHGDKEVKVVRIRREVAPTTYATSSCGCCCAPATYTRTYTTEPVVVRHYTRTYTRLAPPSCGHGATYSHGGHYKKHHHEKRGGYHQQYEYHEESRYGDGRQAHGDWRANGYDSVYGGGPVYPENTVIWSSDGSHRERTGYTARRDEYSYYQAKHGSPRIIYRD